jgi:hypothetical protein
MSSEPGPADVTTLLAYLEQMRRAERERIADYIMVLAKQARDGRASELLLDVANRVRCNDMGR